MVSYMEKNLIEKFELLDGNAIIDMNYCVITANEQMYRFLGISASVISIIESIHQVDVDDFMDVCEHLKEDEYVDMVLRIRRSDNSYRWILLHIAKFAYRSEDNEFEYLEMNASDILSLKRRNMTLQDTIKVFRQSLNVKNETFMIYDYRTKRYQINSILNDEIYNILDMNIMTLKDKIETEHLIDDSTMDEYNAYCKNIKNGTLSYRHIFKTNILNDTSEFDTVELAVHTIYQNDKPSKAIGSIHNLSDKVIYEKEEEEKSDSKKDASSELYQFCVDSVLYKANCEFSLILFEIDDYERIKQQKGTSYAQNLYKIALRTTTQLVGQRGIVCDIKQNLIGMVVKDINNEVVLRAFIESLRNQISWNVLLTQGIRDITFSIGIARYPQNGLDMDIVYKKLYQALNICHMRGKNRYIIYREHLHGELK